MPPVRPAPAPRPSPAKPAPKPAPQSGVPKGAPPASPLPRHGQDLWPGAGEALNFYRGPRGARRVCMTFDGGSTAEVALDILDALKARHIRTTFFLTGAFIRHYPDLVRRMADEGHEIGNHTLTHPHLAPGMRRDPRWTRERFQAELLETDRLFLHLVGRPMDPLWRAPYGEQTAEIRTWAEELGYRHVGWSEGADTLDWATVKERRLYHSGDAILDRLSSRMERRDGEGLIVLMHLGSGRPERDRPGRILGPWLDRALAAGWTFTTVGSYLKDSGKPVWDPRNRLPWLMGQ
nr:polysaccharide deacetylase family protein [uncultured Holophaga sp.]